jgi:DNA-binding MarR family transcriptional regulator
MSTKKSRQEYIQLINEEVRDNGNTNVLLVHAIAQHLGLSATEFECCDLIAEKGPFTAGELARLCRISTGGMTGMIDRLEKKGFVTRKIDHDDRRRVLVSGKKNTEAILKVRKLYNPMQHAFGEILADYSDAEIEFIYVFMSKVNQMFHQAIEQLPEKHVDGKS